MKSIITAVAALMLACTASAQYAPTKEGMALNYKQTVQTENGETVINSTDTIKSITTADGKTTVRIKSCVHPDNALADDIVMYSYATYTTPDEPTTIMMMMGEDFKSFILNMIKMDMEQAGQYNESQFKEVENNSKAKGELSLVLNPKGAVGDKIPNSRLRLDIGMQAATMFVSNGAIAGYESVTVPAGTFDNCIKVTYEKRENSPQGSNKSYVTAWYAPEIGLVKEQEADKKGNIQSSQELISF